MQNYRWAQFHLFTSEKLNQGQFVSNELTWSQQVSIMLCLHLKWPFLEGKTNISPDGEETK